MDLKKVGKFIAELRKRKNLTQDKLGEILGVNGKTISKWERGINAPDISILNNLSAVLGVSVSEILNGERKSLIKIDDITDKIKYYIKKNSAKNIKISIIIILIILILFSMLFLISNFNQFKVYNVFSENEKKYDVDGYVILNNKRNFIIIRNIDIRNNIIDTNDELLVKYLKVNLYSNDKSLCEVLYGNYKDFVSINDYLVNKSIFLEDSIEMESNAFKTIDKNKFYITLEYSDNKEEIKKIKIPLQLRKEYSNNKLIY